MPNRSQWFAITSALVASGAAVGAWLATTNGWAVALAVLATFILSTVVSVAQALLHQVKLDKAPVWMEGSKLLGSERERVEDHYDRLKGTLVYWKNEAAAYRRLHFARVVWSLLSAVLLPVLIQFYKPNDPWAKAFLTSLTTWTGLVVALAYTLKAEHRYQGMRQQESDYYDSARDFLDSLKPDDPSLVSKVEAYFAATRAIRRTARKVETGAPPSATDAR